MPKSEPQPPLTKRRFMQILKKAATPISDWNKHDSKDSKTSVVHLSDGCSETRRNQDNPGGKEDGSYNSLS